MLSKKITILYPALHYPPVIGGLELWMAQIAERQSRNIEVLVITGSVRGAPSYERKGSAKIFRWSIFALKDLSYSSYLYIATTFVSVLIRSLYYAKKHKVDFFHCHGTLGGVLGWMLRLLSRTPYFVTIQSADFDVYHSKLKWASGIHGLVEGVVFRGAAGCHSVSESLRRHYEKRGVMNSVVIPNGVDIDIFKPIEDKKALRRKLGIFSSYVFSCVSRLEYKNGTHDLIEAMRHIEKRFKDFTLVIVGDGTDREKLQDLAKRLNIRDKVMFTGAIPHKETAKYIGCSDVFIRPSLAEGFGIVFIEAMAAGVPVIGTKVGGIPDFLKDGETGIFCKVSNPESIAEKIIFLLSDHDLNQRIARNGLRLVRENYTWDNVARRMGRVYTNLV